MKLLDDDLSSAQALVIDGNPTSRSILATQLRDLGVNSIVQCARLADARRQLEVRNFDIVLCELHFPAESSTGQDLLDELRRNQMLPFSTIFIMVTAEATYARVAEAAESALDGYLLKPHKAAQLGDRLRQARMRKNSLQEIFTAIEAEDFDGAAELCLQRFRSKGKFWLYAARVGAELMLRTGKYAQAQSLYEAVVAAKTSPWAKLGVARSLLDAGQVSAAVSTIDNLISEEPSYTDAYDVMGRAQVELGDFDAALATYRLASELTPDSVIRLQNLGLMAYYAGQRKEAEKILDRASVLGRDSNLFDCQTLVLLAFARLESGDSKGMQRCREDMRRVLERNPDSRRHQRLSGMVEALAAIQQHQFAQAVDTVRAMATTVKDPDLNFEGAANLLALLAQLASKAIQLEELNAVVDTLGLRFCGSQAQTELLAGAVAVHPPYAERLHAAHAQILRLAEHAVSLSMEGDPQAAVKTLLADGQATLSSKLVDTAHLVLQRYGEQIEEAEQLNAMVREFRSRYASSTRAALGEQKRQAGGLSLRTDATPGKVPTVLK